jgi:hypothetical protein
MELPVLKKTEELSIERIENDSNGAVQFTISSSFQKAKTRLRILYPDGVNQSKPLKQIYTLPVQPGEGGIWGDPLQVIKSGNLHHQLHILAICPSFSDWPWYADHPEDRTIRQESYFIHVILPLVDELYPGSQTERVLLGFSKSGVGAFSLLLRHADLFTCAGAWDAPLMKEKPDEFEMEQIYGAQANFEQYQFSRLLLKNKVGFTSIPRFVLAGYDVFKDHIEEAHKMMISQAIPHLYQNNQRRAHRWDSGWFEWMLSSLVNLAGEPSTIGSGNGPK